MVWYPGLLTLNESLPAAMKPAQVVQIPFLHEHGASNSCQKAKTGNPCPDASAPVEPNH
jgi:hypothetical protein